MQKGITSLIKVLLILVICLSTTTVVFSQAPQLLNYQGVARNSVGNAIPNKTMTLRISIRNGSVTGSALYVETRQIKTNGAGLFATQIGSSGSISTVGSLSGVSWSSGLKFLQVELDPEGGSSFLDMGTSQLVSVPYALNADNATNVTGVISLANGGTGATSAAGAKTNIGLGNVDNTSDLNKPISTAAQAALNTKEDAANKSTNTALGNSDVLYPTQKAVKVYVDEQVLVATPDATTSVKGKVQLAGDLSGTADFPIIANAAVTTAKVADASITTIKMNDAAITSAKIADAAVTDGKIVGVSGSKITGNITGNAANITGTLAIANGGTGATTVVGAKTALALENVENTTDLNKPISTATQTALNTKEDAANKSTNSSLGNSDVLYPSQKAVKAYVDAQVQGGATPDASNAVKGKVLLAGDLTGTADLPRIANAAVTTAKVADASITTIKMNDAAITSAKIADAAVTSAKITDGAITSVKLNDAAVTTAKLNDAAITSAKIADAAVTDSKIVGVSGSKITGNITGNAANITGTLAIANGGTGATTVLGAKTALALENVENTTDLNKPISTATQTALDAKENSSNKSTDVNLGTSDALYSSQKAVKTYVDTKVATSVTSVGSILTAATANGASITSGVLSLSPANGTNGGIVTTSAQTFAGAKTFASDIVVNGVKIGRGGGNNGQNIAIGADALASGTGTRNTAVGYGAMRNYSGTSFDNNTSVGYWNMPSLTSGNGNTSVGAEAMLNITTGTQNTSVGNQSLINTTGNNNVGIGKRSGETNTTGSQNTFIGTDANAGTATLSNATAIGYGATVAVSNTIQLGNASVTNVKTNGTITAGAVTYPSSHGSSGQVLGTNGSGTLVWQNASTLSPTYYGIYTPLNSTHNGAIIYTEHGGHPVFPNDLPDGFKCTIIMHSNFPWTSNTLTTARFFSKLTGWNNGTGSTTFSMPTGGVAEIRVVTIGGLKCYFVSGDIN